MSNRAERRAAAKKHAVDAAVSIADDVTTGRLDPEQLEAEAVKACREVAGTVLGPEDPIWPLQVDIARQVLAIGGAICANELAEWSAVERSREKGKAAEGSWIEQVLAEGADEDDDDAQ
ncbi:hypothetical protein BST36_29680 [Mycolicibacterium moriokaense]|uniref:Flagellar hook-length control protein n=1 Tax=Mycolicibacterium moriokaense TaxID=39691 RepID=A0AAD1M642_9MYCO|nr:hypothetical protein [Mycolicibacterium moriokaense]MCV7037464.1 flagellar hook-length control protein [Mycolicibacterium moriokaense]ORB13107.1 hypothetical protein BST36_29680 [Mycolicibacterium moriokaense]BBX00919.1 hypothetical protein MMOR_18550 [Mycolicibacterium moriokaense]